MVCPKLIPASWLHLLALHLVPQPLLKVWFQSDDILSLQWMNLLLGAGDGMGGTRHIMEGPGRGRGLPGRKFRNVPHICRPSEPKEEAGAWAG